MRLGRVDLVRTGRQVARQAARDDIFGLSAELAYRFFLAIFPFFIFLAALGGFLAARLPVRDPTEQIVAMLGDVLPPEASSLIGAELERVASNRSHGLLSVGLLGALIFATSGTQAVLKALNRAYDVPETRPFWKRYAIALGLTVLAGSLSIAAFVLFVAGQFFGRQIATALGIEGAFWFILLLGAELNQVIDDQVDRAALEARRQRKNEEASGQRGSPGAARVVGARSGS